MFDDAVLRYAVVPHQRVVGRHVHQHRTRVLAPVQRVGGAGVRRVMFDHDARQGALGCAQFVLFLFEPLPSVLVDDQVERHALQLVQWRFMHVVAPRKHADAAAVVGAACSVGHQIEVVRNLREVVEVVAMHMPGEDAQAATAWPCRRAARGGAGCCFRHAGLRSAGQAWPSAALHRPPLPHPQPAHIHGRWGR